MSRFDLLSAVQPAGGWFAVVGIKDDPNPAARVRQLFAETREEVDALAASLMAQNRNVFFGVAKYETDTNRTKDNVKSLQSFWLDIDCGPTKAEVNPKTGKAAGYVDQNTGLSELMRVCKAVGLPRPIIVNSGRGLHIYWSLDREVMRWEWEPVANRLREVCDEHGLLVDPAVFEVARILRIPGTMNFKDDPPKPVTVITGAAPVNFEAFRDLLGVAEAKAPAPKIKRELTELGKSLQDNEISIFKKIIKRSVDGTGCAQLHDCFVNQDTLSEPRWFDALSIAKYCEDAALGIHKMSEGHPDYDPAQTEEKIRHIVGPHTCAVFERNNPGGCHKCPHKGKIKSPIMLGRDIREASGSDYIVQGADDVTYVIPKYPKPYYRGEHGGIYIRLADEEAAPILVYEHDLYVVKRMLDPEEGVVTIIRFHDPQSGVIEFRLNNMQITSVAEIREVLAKYGVLTHPKRYDLLTRYIVDAAHTLQLTKKVEPMHSQFGWADNDTKFIIGDREITVDGIFHSTPSATTAEIAKYVGPVGSLDKWKAVWELYTRPGMEPFAFAALTGFAAPLFKFFGQRGAMINLIHPKSGSGKTTLLHMINSVWGAPDRMCATKSDTNHAKMMRLGIYNNLPLCVDEITNMKAEEFSELVYGITQGRHRDRVKGSSNELRINNTTWCTMAVFSSNASFVEKLEQLKTTPDGELMRLIEYKLEYSNAIDTDVAKQLFDFDLLQNYGHAGPIYMDYVLKNLDEVRTLCTAMQAKLDRELNLTQRERFWSAEAASILTAAKITTQIGLVIWDFKALYEFVCNLIRSLRMETSPPPLDVSATIGDYINRHMQNILVVKDGVDLRSNMAALPKLEPRGELLIRYEPDTQLLFLSAKAFKNDCVVTQVNYRDTVKQLEAMGILKGSAVKRLSKGMKINSPGVYCLVLDCKVSDFLDMNALVGADDEEEEAETEGEAEDDSRAD